MPNLKKTKVIVEEEGDLEVDVESFLFPTEPCAILVKSHALSCSAHRLVSKAVSHLFSSRLCDRRACGLGPLEYWASFTLSRRDLSRSPTPLRPKRDTVGTFQLNQKVEMSKLQAPDSSVAHDSVRRGVEPDLCSVSTGRVKTLYTVVVPCLIEPYLGYI
jgi:hypothetical protein